MPGRPVIRRDASWRRSGLTSPARWPGSRDRPSRRSADRRPTPPAVGCTMQNVVDRRRGMVQTSSLVGSGNTAFPCHLLVTKALSVRSFRRRDESFFPDPRLRACKRVRREKFGGREASALRRSGTPTRPMDALSSPRSTRSPTHPLLPYAPHTAENARTACNPLMVGGRSRPTPLARRVTPPARMTPSRFASRL